MIALKTKMTMTRFFAVGQELKSIPEERWTDGLREAVFVPRAVGIDEKNTGLSKYGNELELGLELKDCMVGSYLVFSFRVDELKLDQTQVKMRVNAIVEKHKAEEETASIPASQRREIKEMVVEELAEETPPKTKNYLVIVDKGANQVFFGGSSESILDEFILLMQNAFDVRIQEANPLAVALHSCHLDEESFDKVLDEPTTSFINDEIEVHPEFEDSPEGKVGSSFLTTLLYWASIVGEREGIELMIQDPIVLSGEALGSKTVTLKGGTSNRCGELQRALKAGKRVSKAKVVFGEPGIEEELVYSVVLDKAGLKFSTADLPKPKEVGVFEYNYAILLSLSRLAEMVDMMMEQFISFRYANNSLWNAEKENIADWIDNKIN